MDSLYVSVFQDESGSHASRAITSEQLVLLAPPFMRPKVVCRIARREDQYRCASTELFACAA
jgi:hypothetical protein